jgi:tRNA 2-thiouridine synthesizing protein A
MTPEADLAGLTPDKVVDARGIGCPGPLLEAKKSIVGVGVGNVLELWSSDPDTKTDVGAWAGKIGHEFLGFLPSDGYERVFIRRTK